MRAARLPARSSHRWLAALAGGALLLSACGGTPPTSAPPSTTPTPASPTPTPAPTPSPSPKAAWVEAVAALADPTASINATVTGSLDVGAAATIDGVYEQDGRDMRLALTIDVAGVKAETEQRIVGDEAYLKAGTLWRHEVTVSGANRAATLNAVLARVTGGVSKGMDTVSGRSVERFALTGLDDTALAAALGLSDPGVDLLASDFSLLASPSGEPVGLDLSFTAPGDPNPGVWDLRIVVTALGGSVSVERPEESWRILDSPNGYSIWYPDDFQTDSDPATASDPFSDWYFGETETARVSCVPSGDYTLASWTKEGQSFYADAWGRKHDGTQSFEIPTGPTKVILSIWTKADVDGEPTYVNVVSIVAKPLACDILWFRGLGTDDVSDNRFGKIVGSFKVE